MKKVFFAIVAVSLFAFTACNNKPAEGETATTDTAAVVAPVEETAPVAVDSAAMPVDSAAAAK
jgi:uncharacterized lipoprotein YajG